MKPKVLIIFVSMLLALTGLDSCSRARSDAAVIADVQTRIHQDSALASASINVQSSSGVVVLSGTVATDTARIAAENVARQVQGVKGVINNVQVATAAPSPAPAAAGTELKSSRQRPGPPREMPRTTKSRPDNAGTSAKTEQHSGMPVETAATPPADIAVPQPVQAAVSQPVQSLAAQVIIPEGTRLAIRLIDPIDTERNKEGDTFRASLDSPIVIDGKTVVPKYADATARLVSAKSAGRFAGSSSVVLVLSQIVIGNTAYDLETGEYAKQGASRGGRTAKVVGGTAAVGAVIGAIAGGGKGAAVGAAAGAGAGTAAQALTKGEQIKLPAESLLEFQLKAPLTVTFVT